MSLCKFSVLHILLLEPGRQGHLSNMGFGREGNFNQYFLSWVQLLWNSCLLVTAYSVQCTCNLPTYSIPLVHVHLDIEHVEHEEMRKPKSSLLIFSTVRRINGTLCNKENAVGSKMPKVSMANGKLCDFPL